MIEIEEVKAANLTAMAGWLAGSNQATTAGVAAS